MPWWNFRKQEQHPHQPEPAQPAIGVTTPLIVGRRPPAAPPDAEAVERQRKRTERRVQDLRYDIAQAQAAASEPNRWTERIDQITQAIDQARRDAEAALSVPEGRVGIELPPLPVIIEEVLAAEPARVRFQVGDLPFNYQEEVDWAERGHQKADGLLRRVTGDVDALLPPGIPPERVDELREHLAHGLATLAEQLRDDAAAGRTTPPLTLADLASPCPVCGGWRDLRGRCPACQERQWLSDRLRADADRLMKERNEQLNDMQRMRERLPMLQRQLADVEATLEEG